MNKKVVSIIKSVLISIGLLFCFVPISIVLISDNGFDESQSNLFLSICFGCLALSQAVEITASIVNKEIVSNTSIGLFIAFIFVIIVNLI